MKLIDAEPIEIRYNTEALGRREMYEMVKTAPIIDAVPVVRCKDCTSFHYSGMGGDNGITYCARLVMTEMQPTDFCSYGERKDDEL